MTNTKWIHRERPDEERSRIIREHAVDLLRVLKELVGYPPEDLAQCSPEVRAAHELIARIEK